MLINLNTWKTQNAQMARWISEISEYDFEIKHKKGDLKKHVDALSRAPVAELENFERETLFTIVTREDEILAFQRSEERVLEGLRKRHCPLTTFSFTETKTIRVV